MFNWTADLTATGDRSEFTEECYQVVTGILYCDTDTEALRACIRLCASAMLNYAGKAGEAGKAGGGYTAAPPRWMRRVTATVT